MVTFCDHLSGTSRGKSASDLSTDPSKFQVLQQKIADLARLQPENLRLVLGSFAVINADNKIMNVVALPLSNFTNCSLRVYRLKH
jgi:hypothetical protein